MTCPTFSPSVNFLPISNYSLPTIQEILTEQMRGEIPKIKGIFKKENIIYYHNSIWIPANLRQRVIGACHIITLFHHNGSKSTARTIQRVFNWANLYGDVISYRKSCLGCQRMRQ